MVEKEIMWLEIKAVFTIIGAFIISLSLFTDEIIIGFMVFFLGLVVIMMGDIIIGWKIVYSDAVNLIDPVAPGEKIAFVINVGGGVRFLKGKEGLLGKLEFMLKKNKAGIIDDGKAPFRTPNGNPMIMGHVLFDKNINPVKAKYLEEAFEEDNSRDVKELYVALKDKEKEDGNT